MKFKGTKGEWLPNIISGVTIGVNAEILTDDHGTYSQNVCEFILPDSDEEYDLHKEAFESNAKLIAAAPDLLEALQNCLETFNLLDDTIEKIADHETYFNATRNSMEVAQKAIEKALK